MAHSTWQATTLGEVLELKRGYDLPARDRSDGPFPIVSSSGVSGYHASAMAKAPGVVTGRYGTLGQVFFIERDYWPLNTALYVRDFKGNDPRFVAYFLKTLDFMAYSDKAAVPGLNRNHLHMAEVKVPPLPEQRAIAAVLGALDDKIEVNRKTARVLEGIARAVFTSWFVDFDPVRRAAAGRPTGLLADLAALFPKRMVDSAIGEVPEGWRVADVYSVADVVYGAPYKSDLFNDRGEGKPLIRIRDLATHDPATFTPEQHPRGYLVRPGDLVVGMDGEFRAHMWTGPDSWLNQRLCCFKPTGGCPQSFVRFSIDQPLAFFERSKTGTTVVHLGKADIDTFKVLVPSEPVLRAFGSIGDALEQRVVACAQQSATLAALRDALLPKLISGELRIADAERIVGRAV